MIINLNQAGQFLDIVGVLLLFKYGLPSEVKAEEGSVLSDYIPEDERTKVRLHNSKVRKRAYIGLGFVLLGFILQFFGSSNWF